MHLLVLGAFFRTDAPEEMTLDRLNAPSGAGCFLVGIVGIAHIYYGVS